MDRNVSEHGETALQRMEQIEKCLIDLLLTMPYPQVNVTRICRQVGISRVTFYQYYENKDACLGSAIDHLFREAMLYLNRTVPASASPLETCTMMMDFWKAKKAFFDIFRPNNLFHIVLERAVRFAAEEDFLLLMPVESREKEWDRDILANYVGGQIAFMTQWYLRDFDTPSEEMAEKYLCILQSTKISTQRKVR